MEKILTRVFATARLGVALAVFAAPTILSAQFDFKIGDVPIQTHTFGSQGFLYSNQNNYLTTKSSDGSFAMTDGGANVSARITERFRAGAQVYISNVGELNRWHPQLDWAFGDYRFKDWFGVRAGKVKTTLGLFNDTQDTESLYNWALLPQSSYPVDLRDNTIAHSGVDLYGEIALRHAGSLNYTAYAGQSGNNRRGGYYFSTLGTGAPIHSFDAKVAGADVRWATGISGLTTGVSFMRKDLSIVGQLLQSNGYTLPNGGYPYSVQTNPEHIVSAYGEYSRGKVHLTAEYRRDHEMLDVQIAGASSAPSNESSHGWFAAGSYKLAKRLEIGSYYSAFYVDSPSTPEPAANHIFDRVISARFEVNRFVHLKLEEHFIDGYGDVYSAHGFYALSNPGGTKPTTNLLVIRTGFSF